jgi:hypothetical protein
VGAWVYWCPGSCQLGSPHLRALKGAWYRGPGSCPSAAPPTAMMGPGACARGLQWFSQCLARPSAVPAVVRRAQLTPASVMGLSKWPVADVPSRLAQRAVGRLGGGECVAD